MIETFCFTAYRHKPMPFKTSENRWMDEKDLSWLGGLIQCYKKIPSSMAPESRFDFTEINEFPKIPSSMAPESRFDFTEIYECPSVLWGHSQWTGGFKHGWDRPWVVKFWHVQFFSLGHSALWSISWEQILRWYAQSSLYPKSQDFCHTIHRCFFSFYFPPAVGFWSPE